ncbi:mini-chromosome maintenance complex-binding protein isoform X3 [Cryptotermes secundus]|nr:mini-chromosome maintenance complex-binding protein isoform X3 [Cryptotermes secundus]
MIQDMQNPEMYLEQYEVQDSITKQTTVKMGKYRDIPACGPDEVFIDDSRSNVHRERQVLCCISIPALNPWVKQLLATGTDRHTEVKPLQHENKRAYSDESASSNKALSSSISPPGTSVKRVCCDKKHVPRNVRCDTELHLPLPESQAKTCLVKVYDSDPALALNDMIEVVGFLSVDPRLCLISEEMEDEGAQFHNLPGSLVPRLHAVSVRKLKHNNPLLELNFCSSADEVLGLARLVRQDLHLVLSQVLLGDHLAANYFICHLISSVFQRSELLALGQLSLNISNVVCGHGYTEKLYTVLRQLVTKSHYQPLTIENLNKCTFTPKKDYDANRLVSGILQLSTQTHLVLDETCLEPGQLDSNGVHNVAALGTLISQQKVDYDFQFYKLEFKADVPVLVLSEGKSLLPNDVAVPLEPDSKCLETWNEIFEAVNHYLQEPVLQRLRKYLTAVRLLEYCLPQDLEQVIQDDFVRLRRETDTKTSASDLHLLLVLSRLVSLSQGEGTLSRESWDLACSMEKQRKQRINGRVHQP